MDFTYLQSFFFGEEEDTADRPEENTANRPGEDNTTSAGDVENQADQTNDRDPSSPARKTVTFARGISSLVDRIRSLGKESAPPDIEVSKSGESVEGNKSDTSGTGSDTSDASTAQREKRKRRERSPRRGRSRTPQQYSSTLEDEEEMHIGLFTHGKIWTVLGVLFTWAGFACAFMTRQSTQFVTLDYPIYIDPNFEEVSEVGMINLQICYNETYSGMTGCDLHQLTTEDVDDTMFQVSRSVAFMALLLGGFMSIFLTAATFWHSINLRPVGLGYLLAYFLQSFTFLFFDTTLCAEYSCHLASGSIFSIAASACWILTCIAASRMDAFKYKEKRRRQRRTSQSRSNSPQKRPKKNLDRGVSSVTAETDVSIDRISDLEDEDSASAWSGRSRSRSRSHSVVPLALNPQTQGTNICYDVIKGIQDLEATEAWMARKSPRHGDSSRNGSSPRDATSPRNSKSPRDPKSPRDSTSSRNSTSPRNSTSSRSTSSPSSRADQQAFFQTSGMERRSSKSERSVASVDRSLASRQSRKSHRSRSSSRPRSKSRSRTESASPARHPSRSQPRSRPPSRPNAVASHGRSSSHSSRPNAVASHGRSSSRSSRALSHSRRHATSAGGYESPGRRAIRTHSPHQRLHSIDRY